MPILDFSWIWTTKLPISLRIPQPGYINGEAADVEVETLIPAFSGVPYIDQLNNIWLWTRHDVVVPIFNNNSVRANAEKAKINVLNSNETAKLKQTLKTNIENALTSARAARKSMEAAEASSMAAKYHSTMQPRNLIWAPSITSITECQKSRRLG